MAVEVNNTATQANADKRTYSVQEIADILQISRSMAQIKVSCLHLGQYSGKWSSTVSWRNFILVLFLQTGQSNHSVLYKVIYLNFQYIC